MGAPHERRSSAHVSPLNLTAVGKNQSSEKGLPNVSLRFVRAERFGAT